ncbi:MAG: hypothetical protein H0T59_02275 [Chloroflexi bacterium]|nr:hypothetical protein [Chloroflexota bacterium]
MAMLLDVQQGWKVFAQADEIGEVVDVGPTTFDVRTGTLIQHTYRISEAHIAEAADGLVDLRIDRETVETMEVHENGDHPSDPGTGGAGDVAMDELPDEYRRIEFGEDVDVPPDPRDGTTIVP